ncbi:neuraminidase-like domain-containing protein [Pseudomonas lini]
MLAYLTRLEEVANLEIVNGYIDGSDFANSTYYFIAKSRAANTWYWRSLDMACRPFVPGSRSAKYDAPEPQAWSDWHRINLPVCDSTLEHTIRPVMFNNRLYVIWAECIFQDQAANEEKQGQHQAFVSSEHVFQEI